MLKRLFSRQKASPFQSASDVKSLNRYPNYDIDYSCVDEPSVRSFLTGFDLTPRDLVVVASQHARLASSLSDAVVWSVDLAPAPEGWDACERLFWCTERADRRAKVAHHFILNRRPYFPMREFGPARSWHHDPIKQRVLIEEYRRQKAEGIEKFGYGIGADFGNLLQFIDQAARLDGAFVEIGCYLGSSSCVMVSYMRTAEIRKPFFFYDVFDGFDYPEATVSADSSWKGTHKTDGLESVRARVLKRASHASDITMVKRNVCEANPLREVGSIAFANVDVDLYEAVGAGLRAVHEKIVPGGLLVVEDPGHTPRLMGALAALHGFLDEVGADVYTVIQMESGQYLLVRR